MCFSWSEWGVHTARTGTDVQGGVTGFQSPCLCFRLSLAARGLVSSWLIRREWFEQMTSARVPTRAVFSRVKNTAGGAFGDDLSLGDSLVRITGVFDEDSFHWQHCGTNHRSSFTRGESKQGGAPRLQQRATTAARQPIVGSVGTRINGWISPVPISYSVDRV
jgi:hypothetical protein